MPAPTKPQLAIYAALAVAVVLIGARFLRGGEQVAVPAPSTPALTSLPDGASAAPPAGAPLLVDVKGAVRRPGVYRLRAGARALDAVRRAGGLTARADRIAVNLAARIVDGGELVVPARGAARPLATGAGEDPAAPLALDLNTATAEELEQLDGVGPATAAKIVAYREQQGGIASIEQLDEVSGIGEAKLAAIRAQLGQ
jgi:competence protein ComEA